MTSTPQHVALIMDGNRRWAGEHGLPATYGHRAGLERLLDLLPLLEETDIPMVTVFAFSKANWRRSGAEVQHLFTLAVEAFRRFTPVCIANDVSVEVIGRRDRLPARVKRCARDVRDATRNGSRLLRLALDYSSRESLLSAAATCQEASEEAFAAALERAHHSEAPHRNVDLLIRTGKEQRLSDFLLWESAFAELYFPDVYWPDFSRQEFHAALDWYAGRGRRFGG
jgi:undecaprenyl diphosphate synthase